MSRPPISRLATKRFSLHNFFLLIAAAALPWLPAGTAIAAEEGRLLFAGDVMLAREAAHEIGARGASPWLSFSGLGRADFAMANFEGAVGDGGGCPEAGKEPCFEVRPGVLHYLAEAGFTALGLANNHAGDLGKAGQRRTEEELRKAGLDTASFEDSPGFVRIGAHTVAIVAVNLVRGRDSRADAVPSFEAERKLRLARALADWVIVYVHWGAELKDWPQPSQRSLAEWFIAHGADAVIGSHPHVVIAPECVNGRPVFYSLGNHVFDQKYPETKRGMIADCRIREDRLACGALATVTPAGSSFPALAGPAEGAAAIAECAVAAQDGLRLAQWRLRAWGQPGRLSAGALVIEGRLEPDTPGAPRWKSQPLRLLSISAGLSAEPPLLLTAERHPSPIDGEDGPRPYVYEVTPHGLVARWRGSALAWPLVDARAMADGGGSAGGLLCALHRADSFIQLNPASKETRTAVYRWAGFGFRAVHDEGAEKRCCELYAAWDAPR